MHPTLAPSMPGCARTSPSELRRRPGHRASGCKRAKPRVPGQPRLWRAQRSVSVDRWKANELLTAAGISYRLADNGEDLGRLVAVFDDGRSELLGEVLGRAQPDTAARVQHAIALFRRRGAGDEDKRSALITLAGILEERRQLIKAELVSADEGALFHIANKFAIRHQNRQQLSDTSPPGPAGSTTPRTRSTAAPPPSRGRAAVQLPPPGRDPPLGLDPGRQPRWHHDRLEQEQDQGAPQPRTTRPGRVRSPARPGYRATRGAWPGSP